MRPDLEVLIKEYSTEMSQRMVDLAKMARSEEDIRHGCNKLIDDFLSKAVLEIKGWHEYGLAGGRIDSKYGGVIIEYKSPKGSSKLIEDRNAPGVKAVVKQIKQRFLDFQSEENVGLERIFAIGCDGNTFVFVKYRGKEIEVEDPQPVSPHTVERVLRALLSIGAQGYSFSPDNLCNHFGAESEIAQDGIGTIYNLIINTDNTKALTFFRQWQILFGEVCGYNVHGSNLKIKKLAEYYMIRKAQPAALLFSLHTYYAIFIKLLATEIVTSFSPFGTSTLKKLVSAPTSEKLRSDLFALEQGGIWAHLGIRNFLEGDLFSWYIDAWDDRLADCIRDLAMTFDKYDPTTLSVDPADSRDLLKKLYQHLFPKTVRHDLGEYYTPDWLAEFTLDQLGYDGNPNSRLLDPACGSGTFLVMTINRIKAWYDKNRHNCGFGERELLDNILKNVIGFDLNPLAVMAARTNYLLAIRDLVRHADEIEIPIYLCDSVMTPSEYGDLFTGGHGKSSKLKTSAGDFLIPTEVTNDRMQIAKYADILESCIRNRYDSQSFLSLCIEQGITLKDKRLHQQLYQQLQELDTDNKNGIWARIIKNAFAPLFIKKVDFIAGNPPWINWNSLPSDYRRSSGHIWKKYNLWPKYLMGASADFSILFFYSSVDTFLKNGGKIGFVITQSIFKTDGGNLFRNMELPNGEPIKIITVHDFSGLKPFEAASNRTALIVARRGEKTKYPIEYIRWQPKVPRHLQSEGDKVIQIADPVKEVAIPSSEENTSPWLTGSFRAVKILTKLSGNNSHKGFMGIHTYGANAIYFIDVLERRGIYSIIQNVATGAKIKADEVQAKVENEMIYPLLRGRDIRPFYSGIAQHIIFPYEHNKNVISEADMRTKYPKAYDYFMKFEKLLNRRSQLKRAGTKAVWYQLFSVYSQTFYPYKVAWREQADFMAATVISTIGGCMVVPDHKVMFIPCNDRSEAHCLCAVLNSTPVRLFINRSSIQTQMTTKVIQNVALELNKIDIRIRKKLASLSEEAHAKVAKTGMLPISNQIQIENAVSQIWGLNKNDMAVILREIETSMG